MEKIIKTKGLGKTFKTKKRRGFLKDIFKPEYISKDAVKDLNIEVGRGESVAFLGPNGAGKTTSTKMLTGLIYPSNGEVEVLGYTPFDRDNEFLMRIGLVMGNKAGLNWDLTAMQSFLLNKQIYKISDKDFDQRLEKLTKLLDVVDHLDSQVRKLSLGERMKMELIGAILHAPEILFLDEPTIGLDIISKQKIREFLRQIQKEMGVTLLLTSHDMDDVEEVCDRVVVINEGVKVYDDDLKNLLDQYKGERFVKFIFEENLSDTDLEKLKDLDIVDKNGNTVTVTTSPKEMAPIIAKVSENFELHDIDIVSIPLEEMIKDIFNNGI